eukprot:15482431-Alexandrium_andersonii.AAC.1
MEPFRNVFGIRHKHVRFAPGTNPSALDARRPPPQGACWWCNHCGSGNQIMKWSCRVCRLVPDWPNL